MATVDRARCTEPPLLKWHTWNGNRVRIWSQDARDWYRRGCPTKLAATILVALLLGYGLLNVGCALGYQPARNAILWMKTPHLPCAARQPGRHHHHRGESLYALDDRKAPRQGVRFGQASRD